MMIKTSKQRAYLKSLAMDLPAILYVGKGGVTPEVVESVREALASRELIKLSVEKSSDETVEGIARMIAERTRSEVVQTIGRKIVLYKEGQDDKRKIILP